MEFLTGSNSALHNKLQVLGHDQDSLHYITKDFFDLCDMLKLTPRQTAEYFIRIKKASEASKGGPACDLVLYENNRYNPTRLSVESKPSGDTIFFKIVPGQTLTTKKDILYTCETCNNEFPVKRSEVRAHFQESHNI